MNSRRLCTYGLITALAWTCTVAGDVAGQDPFRPLGGEQCVWIAFDDAEVNRAEADGTTALHWASLLNDSESVTRLIRSGADVNATNDLGATALWAASQNGSEEVVRSLLAAGANPNSALRHGETPLMAASRSGNPVVVEALLQSGANPNATGPRDQTALMWAAAQGHSEVIAVLIEGGANIYARSAVWRMFMAQPPAPHPQHRGWFEHGGNTALLFAARAGDLASVRHLVAAGADVDDRSGWGLSALTLAAYSDFGPLVIEIRGTPFHIGGHEVYRQGGYKEVVEFLLEAGADPNAGASQFTALHTAIMRRDETTVDLLLSHGANPNLTLGAWTPLDRGSGTNYYFHRAWVGAPPVWLAARFGTPDILRRLVEQGADPEYIHRGEHYTGGLGGELSEVRTETPSPLMAAVGMSQTGRSWVYQEPGSDEYEAEIFEKVRLFIELGVDLNAVNDRGLAALAGAISSEYDSVVEVLIASGAQEGPGRGPE